MIENFEQKYARLLEEARKKPFQMLPSVERRGGYLWETQPVVVSKEEIKCAEGAFIEQYCL